MTFQIFGESTAPLASRAPLGRISQEFGYVPDLMGIFAGAPALLKAHVNLEELMKETSLSPTEQEVVLHTVAHMSGCAWSALEGADGEAPPGVIRAASEGQKIDDYKLEALRLYTTGVFMNRGRPSEEIKQHFLAAGYGPQQALEVVLGIGLVTLSALTSSLAHSALGSRLPS